MIYMATVVWHLLSVHYVIHLYVAFSCLNVSPFSCTGGVYSFIDS